MCSDPKGRIRSVLNEQGHTYRSIGEMIGITPQAVSEIVNGRTEGATSRYALATALGLDVEDLWPEVTGSEGRRRHQRDGKRTEGNGRGASGTHTQSHERRRRPRSGRGVSVSICCPKRGVPSSVDLGVERKNGSGQLTVLRCEHFRGRGVDCDMECLSGCEGA